MTKLNLKHLTKISVVKKFMKSQRERKTNVSTEFFISLQRYTHKTLVGLCEFYSNSNCKKLNKLSGQFKRIECDVLLSRTEVNKIMKKAKLQMSSKFFKEFNDHIAYVCSISTKGTKDITIKKMLLAPFSGKFYSTIAVDCVTEKPQVFQEAPIAPTGEQQLMEVQYEVTIQRVRFKGIYNVRSGYGKKKLETSIISLVIRQLKSLGVLGNPVVQILSTKAAS